MNVKRILANAVARRIAYVLVAAVLAWIGLSDARAEIYPNQGSAYSSCQAHLNAAVSQGLWVFNACTYSPDVGSGYAAYTCLVQRGGQPQGCTTQAGHGMQYAFLKTATCANRPDEIGPGPWSSTEGQARNGSVTCNNGCEAMWFKNADGTYTAKYGMGAACFQKPDCELLSGSGYYWNAYIQACEQPEVVCEPGQIKDAVTGQCGDACPAGMKANQQGQCDVESNECPAGEIKSPTGSCLPGEGQCASGEVRGADGTCKRDSDDDGNPDPDDPNNKSFSGGDTCSSPPSCSGDPIACGQARIQWRIDCNTRRNTNVSGGSCGAVPVCTGEKCDALEYSQLLMQWRTTCALEKGLSGGGFGGGGGTGPGGPSNPNGEVDGSDSIGADGDPDGHWASGDEDHEPDDSGYGWARSCPNLPSVQFMEATINFNDHAGPICSFLGLGGVLVLVLASVASLRIVGSA